jgi:hypothetical protein
MALIDNLAAGRPCTSLIVRLFKCSPSLARCPACLAQTGVCCLVILGKTLTMSQQHQACVCVRVSVGHLRRSPSARARRTRQGEPRG